MDQEKSLDVSTLIVGATIVKNKKVLLVRHACSLKADYGHWLLPAGRVETGEGLKEALRREIKEETGLSVKIVRKLGEHIDPYTGDEFTNFLCIPMTSKVEISSELSEARWFNVNEIERLENLHQGLKRFLIDVLRSSSFRE